MNQSTILYNNDDIYYSSDDSEDELDRGISNSKLNTIKSNFTQKIVNSPIFYRKKSISSENSFSHKNYKNASNFRAKSDLRLIQFNKHSPKSSNCLNFFTYGHDRDQYLINNNEINYVNEMRIIDKKHTKVDWKLIYDLIFRENKKNKYEKDCLKDTNSSFSEFFNYKDVNEETNNFDIILEKCRLQILINKIKRRMKKKFEYNKSQTPNDIIINKNNKNKKMNKIPEMALNIKNNENNLHSVYKVGISDVDKNKFIPMMINKLKKKFNIYINRKKYELMKYFKSMRSLSYDECYLSEKRAKKKNDKNKKIKFGIVQKQYTSKYSISEEKLSGFVKNKMNENNLIVQRKTTSKNLNFKSKMEQRKSFIPNEKHLNYLNPRKTLIVRRKNESIIMKKGKISDKNVILNLRSNSIYFNEYELSNINKQKIYLTDTKLEKFKKNAKIIINDEILFKEFNKQYPDYEEELFNLHNNFLLYEKIYDKQELKNYSNKKKIKDFNHDINNFLSLNNKINLPVMKKYDINNKILESAVNLQNIIGYLKD
jgi:hypothetical protein